MQNQAAEQSNEIGDLRVAIVGAGVSGLTAAHYLRKRGLKNVVVFEAENRVGGKICSYSHEGHIYELGAVWSGADYVVITELMKELLDKRRHYTPCNPIDVMSMHLGRVRSYVRCVLEDHSFLTVGRELLRAIAIARRFSRTETVGFADLPAQYHMNFENFAQQNKVENLARLAASFITGCGYGYYREVPAMYVMKLFPLLVRGILRHLWGSKASLTIFPEGWQRLMEEMAALVDVRLGSQVENILRTESDHKTEITVTAGGRSETFDRILLSLPLPQLKTIMDLSDEEASLGELVCNYRYRVALIEARHLPHATVAEHVVRDTIGHVVAIAHFHPDTDVYSIYQLAEDGMSSDDLNRLMNEDIEQAGGSVESVITERFWNYFPHVKTENLAGYYERLENLQGRLGTYYLGSLMNFETVETNAKYAKQLVLERF